MGTELSDDHRDLRDSVRGWAERHVTAAVILGFAALMNAYNRRAAPGMR